MYSLPLTSQTCPPLPSAMITSCVTLPKPPPGSTPRAVSTSSRSSSLNVCAGIGVVSMVCLGRGFALFSWPWIALDDPWREPRGVMCSKNATPHRLRLGVRPGAGQECGLARAKEILPPFAAKRRSGHGISRSRYARSRYGGPRRERKGRAMVEDGDKAPDFEVPTDGGGTLKLSRLRGKPVVLYFYPKDDTSGCTAEAKDFSRLAADFGAEVIGVSPDGVESHQ